jgi:hypothetical protein
MTYRYEIWAAAEHVPHVSTGDDLVKVEHGTFGADDLTGLPGDVDTDRATSYGRARIATRRDHPYHPDKVPRHLLTIFTGDGEVIFKDWIDGSRATSSARVVEVADQREASW